MDSRDLSRGRDERTPQTTDTQATEGTIKFELPGGQLMRAVGLSENIISASYRAHVDSIEYKLLRTRGHG